MNLVLGRADVCKGIQGLFSQFTDVHLQMRNANIPPMPPVCKTFSVHSKNGLFCYVVTVPRGQRRLKKSMFLNMFYSWAENEVV